MRSEAEIKKAYGRCKDQGRDDAHYGFGVYWLGWALGEFEDGEFLNEKQISKSPQAQDEDDCGGPCNTCYNGRPSGDGSWVCIGGGSKQSIWEPKPQAQDVEKATIEQLVSEGIPRSSVEDWIRRNPYKPQAQEKPKCHCFHEPCCGLHDDASYYEHCLNCDFYKDKPKPQTNSKQTLQAKDEKEE